MFCPAFSLAELTATFLSRVQMSRVDPSAPLELYLQAAFVGSPRVRYVTAFIQRQRG